ncbi:unnamed protein product [Cuscuta campestris]|uniref:Uncharacterized protein n=1 Tax=Cuscuta campestris TaxID=132261 RepID=A0A484KY13_9ASTE|nr:unnamed protein product [Cuscuta campestris]
MKIKVDRRAKRSTVPSPVVLLNDILIMFHPNKLMHDYIFILFANCSHHVIHFNIYIEAYHIMCMRKRSCVIASLIA